MDEKTKNVRKDANDPNRKAEDIFRRNLKELRKEAGWTQKETAEKLQIAPSTYANWEQGRTQPGISDIFNLIRIFGIDADELFAADEKRT